MISLTVLQYLHHIFVYLARSVYHSILFLDSHICIVCILSGYTPLHFGRALMRIGLLRHYPLQIRYNILYRIFYQIVYWTFYENEYFRITPPCYLPFSFDSHSVLVLKGNSRSHPTPHRHSQPADPVTDFSIRHPVIISLSVQQSLKSSEMSING